MLTTDKQFALVRNYSGGAPDELEKKPDQLALFRLKLCQLRTRNPEQAVVVPAVFLDNTIEQFALKSSCRPA